MCMCIQHVCVPAGRVVTAEKERKGKQPSLPPPRTPTTATCSSTLLISHTYTFKQALTHPLSAAVKHASRTRQSERAGSKPRLQTCTESSARERTHTRLLTIISSWGSREPAERRTAKREAEREKAKREKSLQRETKHKEENHNTDFKKVGKTGKVLTSFRVEKQSKKSCKICLFFRLQSLSGFSLQICAKPVQHFPSFP